MILFNKKHLYFILAHGQ